VTKIFQGLLVVVLLITIGINIMFILDTSRRLHDEALTASPYDGCIVSPQAWSRGSQTRAHNPSFQGEAGYISPRRSSPAHWEDGAL